jgi:hypothetical protein
LLPPRSISSFGEHGFQALQFYASYSFLCIIERMVRQQYLETNLSALEQNSLNANGAGSL